MIAPTLILLAATPLPQQALGPVRLHPPNAVLYAETPDVADVLIAYEHAPLAQMINDPEVRSAVSDLMSTVEFDIESMLREIASQSDIPPELLAAPIDVLAGYMAGLDSISLSVSIYEETAGAFEQQLLPIVETFKELSALREKLSAHAAGNNGQYPAELAGLGVEEQWLSDGWGRGYEYGINVGGATYTLQSLGADGTPGGRRADKDLATSADFEAAILNEALARLGVTVIVEFSSGATANQTHALLQQLVSETPLRAKPAGDPNAQKTGVLSVYDAGGLPGIEVWSLLHESRLVVGFGTSTAPDYLARLDGEAPSEADSTAFAQLLQQFPPGEGATLSRGYVSLKGLAEQAQGIASVLDQSWGAGLSSVSLSLWNMELVGDRFITELYSGLPDPEDELAQAVGCEPMSEDLWSFVPHDSIIVAATTIDAAAFYRQIMASLGTAAWQQQVPSALTDLEEQYGFSLETDLFGSVGSGVVFYMLPVAGVMSVPGMAIVLELEDPVAFRKGLEGVLALLGDQSKDEFVIKYRPYRDYPMWYFSFRQAGGSPIQISPSLVIMDDHLIVTLTNLRAKREIKRLMQEPGELHTLFSSGLPEGVAAAGYFDWASLTDGVYTAGRALLSLLGGGGELPFDVTALPESETFTQFYKPTIAWSVRDDEGVRVKLASSFGPETFAGFIGVALGATFVANNAIPFLNQAQANSEASVAAGSGGRAAEQVLIVEHRETGKLSAATEAPKPPPTAETLGFLGTRLAIYKLEKARYPAKLEELLKATENYPRGFLGAKTLPTDEWGQAISYSVSEDGREYKLWSLGPDGEDQQGAGDDLAPL